MVHGTDKCVLKTDDGKYVTVRKEIEGPRLCALTSQSELYVYIRRRIENEKKQLAFCFHRKDGDYFPKVDGKELKLHKVDTNCTASDLPKCHWFEKIDLKAGDHYGLQSVAEPQQYLSLGENGTFFCLRGAPEACKLVRDQLK